MPDIITKPMFQFIGSLHDDRTDTFRGFRRWDRAMRRRRDTISKLVDAGYLSLDDDNNYIVIEDKAKQLLKNGPTKIKKDPNAPMLGKPTVIEGHTIKIGTIVYYINIGSPRDALRYGYNRRDLPSLTPRTVKMTNGVSFAFKKYSYGTYNYRAGSWAWVDKSEAYYYTLEDARNALNALIQENYPKAAEHVLEQAQSHLRSCEQALQDAKANLLRMQKVKKQVSQQKHPAMTIIEKEVDNFS